LFPLFERNSNLAVDHPQYYMIELELLIDDFWSIATCNVAMEVVNFYSKWAILVIRAYIDLTFILRLANSTSSNSMQLCTSSFISFLAWQQDFTINYV
jgi:hypothetical protein